MDEHLYAWSIPLKFLRQIDVSIPTGYQNGVPIEFAAKTINTFPFLSKIFKLPVHTYCTIKSDWNQPPLDDTESYWYCAGDFCASEEMSTKSFQIPDANTEFAKCLVKPNMKDDHPERPYKVIGGSYMIDYVCHNIANRVLFAAKPPMTLVNTNLSLVGYKAIVNSHLGVYGAKNKEPEWIHRIVSCTLEYSGGGGGGGDGIAHKSGTGPDMIDNARVKLISKESELLKIHKKALGSDEEGRKVTKELQRIDELYYKTSIGLHQGLMAGKITTDSFNLYMEKTLIATIKETEKKIGKAKTIAIYGDYVLPEIEDIESGQNTSGMSDRSQKTQWSDIKWQDDLDTGEFEA